MATNRLQYIDALRGFTMILVVFAHVETYMLSIDPNTTFISSLFISFRMPLFFFISGYISYKENVVWNISNYSDSLSKKIRIQVIPTLFFGLLYTYLFNLGDIKDFVCNYHKFGYWFTLCLLGLFIILYTSNLFVFYCCKKQNNKVSLFLLFTILFFLYVFRFVYDMHSGIAQISNVFCLHQICTYFPFFMFGYIVSQYKEGFNKFLNNDIIQSCVFMLFCILFCTHWILQESIYEGHKILLVYRSVQYIIIGILGICIIYNFFRRHSASFSKETKVGMLLQKIGRRTLDIYMLHYFFLSTIPYLSTFVSKTSNVSIELFLGISLSLIVIFCCLFVSDILRLSKYGTYYLFGVKKK